MNKLFKQELLEFTERQIKRQEGESREGFSRDPAQIFASFERTSHPNAFRDVTLSVGVGGAKAGSSHAFAEVEWGEHAATMRLFRTERDRLMAIPSFTAQLHLEGHHDEPAQLAEEIVQYLRRRHSLLHPLCTCDPAHYMTCKRQRTLLGHVRNPQNTHRQCQAPAADRIAAEDIRAELAQACIREPLAAAMRNPRVVNENEGYRMKDDAEMAQDPHDLAEIAKRRIEGIQAGLSHHEHEALREGLLVQVHGRLYYANKGLQMHVDEDIARLWQASWPQGRRVYAAEVERALIAESLRPFTSEKFDQFGQNKKVSTKIERANVHTPAGPKKRITNIFKLPRRPSQQKT